MVGGRYDPHLRNNSVGGRTLNDTFVNQLKQFLSAQDDKHYVHVVFLGGNNIRRCFRSDAPIQVKNIRASETVDELIEGYKKILEIAKPFAKTKLVIVSPLTSANSEHEPHFERFANLLRPITAQNGAIFCEIRDTFGSKVGFYENGLVKRVFRPDLFQDDVHLNRAGAKLLAKRVFNTLSQIPNAFFGHKHLSQSTKNHAKNLALKSADKQPAV